MCFTQKKAPMCGAFFATVLFGVFRVFNHIAAGGVEDATDCQRYDADDDDRHPETASKVFYFQHLNVELTAFGVLHMGKDQRHIGDHRAHTDQPGEHAQQVGGFAAVFFGLQAGKLRFAEFQHAAEVIRHQHQHDGTAKAKI